MRAPPAVESGGRASRHASPALTAGRPGSFMVGWMSTFVSRPITAVSAGAPAETAVIGRETNVLIQPTMKLPGLPAVSAGEAWRLARPPLSTAGGALIALSLLALAGFYRWRGSIEVHDKPTGRLIRRFSPAERIVHWSVAISFSVLGITGLVMGLGKYVLLPVFGHTLFAWLADGSKALHNFTGPVFAVFLPILI